MYYALFQNSVRHLKAPIVAMCALALSAPPKLENLRLDPAKSEQTLSLALSFRLQGLTHRGLSVFKAAKEGRHAVSLHRFPKPQKEEFV